MVFKVIKISLYDTNLLRTFNISKHAKEGSKGNKTVFRTQMKLVLNLITMHHGFILYHLNTRISAEKILKFEENFLVVTTKYKISLVKRYFL